MAELRRAHEADAEAIHALLATSFASFRPQYTLACFDATVLDAERVRRRIREGPVWVVEGSDLIGTVGAKRDGDRLYVRGMAVHPEARGQGVGHRLLQRCEEHARVQGLSAMWLSTTTFLDASQALYRRFGFEPCDGPADLCGTALVSFEKRL